MRTALVCLALLVACSSDSSGPPVNTPAPFYVANKGSSSISVFTTADTGNATPALTISGTNTTLNQPEGIVVDPAGVVITTSVSPARIVVFAAHSVGDIAPVASIVGSNTRLSQPRGLALDQGGHLYVSNTASVTLDPGGRIYVANYGTGAANSASVTVYDAGSTGNVTPIATIKGASTLLSEPIGIALDGAGRIYVANSGTTSAQYRITVYAADANGDVAPLVTLSGAQTGLSVPSYLAF